VAAINSQLASSPSLEANNSRFPSTEHHLPLVTTHSSLLAEEIIIPPYPANSRDIVVFPPRHFDPTEVSVASFCQPSKKIANLCSQPLPTPSTRHSFDESDTYPRFYEFEHTQWRRSRLYCSPTVAQGTTMDHKRPTLQRSVGMRRIRA
jgi:hypothetical protein